MKRYLAGLVILIGMFFVHPQVQAVSAGCCIYQLAGKTAGCLDTLIPNYLEGQAKSNPTTLTTTMCQLSAPGFGGYTALFEAGLCAGLNTKYQCGNPPEASGTFTAFKQTEWPAMSFCAYRPADGGIGSGNPYVACINGPVKGVCPTVKGYTSADLYKPPLNKTVCPATNPAAFTAAQQGGSASAGKIPVAAGIKTCVYYKGTYKQENILTCKSATVSGATTYCDAPSEASISVKPHQKAITEINECKLVEQCCVLRREDTTGKISGYDSNQAAKLTQKFVPLQCHPRNLGCDYLFYKTGENVKEGNLGPIEAAPQSAACSAIPECANVTLTADAALHKYEQNKVTASKVQAETLSEAEKKQVEDVSDAAGKPTWTKALCEKEGKNIWAPPKARENETSGPYCYVNPEKAKIRLNVGIGGISVANLGQYMPALFNYALFLLAFLSVIMIVVAGVQYAIAGGNPSIITSAKSLIASSLIALFVGTGGYALLQTVSPALVEFKAPPIPAVIPTEIYMPGDEKICCDDSLLCYQIAVDSVETYILVKGERIKVGKDVWEEIVGKGKCYDVQARGEICHVKGPIADACVRAGGTCISDSSQAPNQQGVCSVFFNNYIIGSLKGFLGAANKVTFGLLSYVGSNLQSAIGVSPSPEDLTPGEGPLGKCVKLQDKRKSGEVCYGNGMCESGKCVRLKQTAGCWVDREYGFCSDGNKGEICDPQNHTIVGGVNTFAVKPICKQGLQCRFVADKGGSTQDMFNKFFSGRPQIEGPYYECSKGELGDACGAYSVDCSPEAVKLAMTSYKLINGACGNATTLLGYANCMYDNQQVAFFKYFDKAHTALGIADTAAWIGTLKATSISKGATKVLGAIAIGLDVAKGVADEEFKRYVADLQRYAFAYANMDPNVQECSIKNLGTKDDALCDSGIGLQCRQAESGALRCLQDASSTGEGSICNGQKNSANKDTCEETKGSGWKCAVNRHPKYVNDSAFYGYCTEAELGSICAWQGKGVALQTSDGSASFNFSPQDCNGVSGDEPGNPICFKKGGDAQEWGECAWLQLINPENPGFTTTYKNFSSTTSFKYPLAFGGDIKTKDGKKTVGFVLRDFKGFCSRSPDIKDTAVLDDACGGAFLNADVQEWAAQVFQEVNSDPKYEHVLGDYNSDEQTNTGFVPVCIAKTPGAAQGQCSVQFQYRKEKGSSSYMIKIKPFWN